MTALGVRERLRRALPTASASWRGGFRLAWLRPRAFEVLAAANVVAVVAFLRGAGLQVGWETVTYTFGELTLPTAQLLAAGMGLQLVRHAVLRRGRTYLDTVLRPEWLLLELRALAACLALIYGYIWLKVSIPLLTPRLLDEQLWNLDVALHLGYSPTIFLTELFRGTPVLELLDRWYSAWLVVTCLGLAFFVALPGTVPRARFLFSHVAIWTLGGWLYLAFPALGPCYANPSCVATVRDDMPRALEIQRRLAANYSKVLAGRSGPVRSLNPAHGIAAMPSLHVGVLWLLTLWARTASRELFALGIAFTTLTFVGSIVTGWHYAVDGYAGLLLGQACYELSRLVERPAARAPAAEIPVAPVPPPAPP